MQQPVPKVCRADVERVVARDYPACVVGEVLTILDRYGEKEWQRERDRVQLAALKLADSDLALLKRTIDLACRDYRDVLAPAEYPTYFKKLFAPKSSEESERLMAEDWKQYEAWFKRT